MIASYDDNTGAMIALEQPPVNASTGVGDSGYQYPSGVFDLLKTGLGIWADKERYEFDSARRYELGRYGQLTPWGGAAPGFNVPAGLNPFAVLIGLVAIGGVLYLALRK